MKQVSLVLIAITLVLGACNNNKTKETMTSEDGKEKADSNRMQNAMQDMEKQKLELEKLQPLSLDQLKALIPESLMGAKSANVEANSSMGANLARANYELNDSTSITLNIYDCGGPAGSGIYSMQYLGLLNDLHDNDEEYLKSIDFNGGKAFEYCDKTINDCTISYFSGGRFMVTVQGEHVGADVLKQAAKGLNIK